MPVIRPCRPLRAESPPPALLPPAPLRLLAGALAGAGLLFCTMGVRAQEATATATTATTATTAAAAAAVQGAVRYRIVNIFPPAEGWGPKVNALGQAAFSNFGNEANPAETAFFFDGRRTVPIGSLGGGVTIMGGINDKGQVTGSSSVRDGRLYAFRWSLAAGMQNLGALDSYGSAGYAINNRGDVTGESSGHAFRWTAAGAMEDLGVLYSRSTGWALNDNGLVTGYADVENGERHSFAWTRAAGIRDITGVDGGTEAFPTAAGPRDEAIGYLSTGAPHYRQHAYLWTAAGGLRDLGALNGVDSYPIAINAQSHIVGNVYWSNVSAHGFYWTARRGMVDLGSLNGGSSSAAAINRHDQVVGGAEIAVGVPHAVIWSPGQPIADLNSRVVNAPAGLVLDAAVGIGDNGIIVAFSNAGYVALRPLCEAILPAPVVGPIDAPALTRVGSPVASKLGFTDANPKEQHHVSWDWGDASMEAGLVSERGGVGSASGSHVYRTPGDYSIVATVSDAAGNVTTMTRRIIVQSATDNVAAGNGKLMSPAGANPQAPRAAGAATFSFIAPAPHVATPSLRFSTDKLVFRDTGMSVLKPDPGQRRMTGTGVLNGKAGYHYLLTVAPGSAGARDRFGLRIWHADKTGKGEVVDYDNQRAEAGANGTAVVEGGIAIAP